MDKVQIKKLVEIILGQTPTEAFEIKAVNPTLKIEILASAIQIAEEMKSQKLDFEHIWQQYKVG